LGLQQEYLADGPVRDLCKKLMALAMMPPDTVSISYDEIRSDAQHLPDLPMKELLNYFEEQWMSDIDIWNVSKIDTRINNTCEGKDATPLF
jgi:hypothetical protein